MFRDARIDLFNINFKAETWLKYKLLIHCYIHIHYKKILRLGQLFLSYHVKTYTHKTHILTWVLYSVQLCCRKGLTSNTHLNCTCGTPKFETQTFQNGTGMILKY